MDTIASRYASALLELAIENDKVISYQSQIKYVLNVFKENRELDEFLKCYTIDDKNKKELLMKIFKDDLDIEVLHFLFLILDKRELIILKRFVLNLIHHVMNIVVF